MKVNKIILNDNSCITDLVIFNDSIDLSSTKEIYY